MKNKLRIVFILIIIVLTSGCSVEYNLNINEDNSISENIIAKENTKRIESLTRLKGEQALSYMIDMYKRNNDKEKFISNVGDDTSSVTSSTTFNDINDYKNSFKSDLFDIQIEKENKRVKLVAYQKELLSNDASSSLIYDEVNVNIYVPFKVIDNNADSVSKNVYTWNINEDSDLKVINITYDEGSLKDNLNFRLSNKTYNINYTLVAVSGIILSVLIIVLIVFVKNKKNNIL